MKALPLVACVGWYRHLWYRHL